jgi:hypothetical protein
MSHHSFLLKITSAKEKELARAQKSARTLAHLKEYIALPARSRFIGPLTVFIFVLCAE